MTTYSNANSKQTTLAAVLQGSQPRPEVNMPVACHEDVDTKVELPPSHQQWVFDVTADEVRLLQRDAGPPAAVCSRQEGKGLRRALPVGFPRTACLSHR